MLQNVPTAVRGDHLWCDHESMFLYGHPGRTVAPAFEKLRDLVGGS